MRIPRELESAILSTPGVVVGSMATTGTVKARGRQRHQPGVMNKTERAYADHLDTLKAAGEVAEYWFEAVKFKLADATFYTPDFMVLMQDGTIEVHEVKGHWEDDARVKFKVFRDKFWPFTARAFTRKGKGWVPA